MDNFRYPTTDQGLRRSSRSRMPAPPNWRTGGYLKATTVPKDPWGNEYRYLQPGTRAAPTTCARSAPTASLGGEDADADVVQLEPPVTA